MADLQGFGQNSVRANSKGTGQLLLTWIPAWPMWMEMTCTWQEG